MSFRKGANPDQAHRLLGKPRAAEHPDVAAALAATLPDSVSHAEWQPAVRSQRMGSCTAFSACAGIQTRLNIIGTPLGFDPSQDTLYKLTRMLERASREHGGLSHLTDTGAQLEDVSIVLNEIGLAPTLGNASGDDDPELGNNDADVFEIEESATHLIVGDYVASPQSDEVAAALAAHIPVWVAFYADRAFEQLAPHSVATAPIVANLEGEGGHAVQLCGYEGPRGERRFRLRNSWGLWCDSGECWVSEAWLAAAWGVRLLDVSIKGGAK